MDILHQGGIFIIENIKHPVLVVSKEFFNSSGEIIGCPIIRDSISGPLHEQKTLWIKGQNLPD